MATTGKYNLISLDALYITNDGTSTGSPCRTEVTGLDALVSNYTGVTVWALDGTPYNQVLQNYNRGATLSIRIAQTLDTRLDELKTLIEGLITDSDTVLATFAGSTGTFSVNCMPLFPTPLQFTGEFQSTNIKNITINLVVHSLARILTANSRTLTLTGQGATLTVA